MEGAEEMTAERAPWVGSFRVEGHPAGHIALRQIDRKQFALDSSLTYVGRETGLEGRLDPDRIAEVRTVTPRTLPVTDLASVPTPLRWLVGRYGVHTPAALVHDRLIGADARVPGMTDADADRYFRFMLRDLGVRLIRRWLMWAAVALRTRWKSGWVNRIGLVVWMAGSLAGMTAFGVGWLAGDRVTVVGAGLAPLAFALLWGRQYGAGVVAAYAAPWIGPPTLFAAGGYLVYAVAEWAASLFLGPKTGGTEPYRYKSF